MHMCSQQGDLADASVMVEKVIASGSQRTVYKVKDLGTEHSWTCRPTQRHCTCDRFIQVLMNDALVCEHVLAAQLSEALGILNESVVPDNVFVDYAQ
ncbi:hypothetical protein B0O80DRAFT_458010 [Mortierella sp. GBAus27b]|nr:hypothetical protein B0O80DRAFT_458010 [Mortierella sp. GBAus27b]